MNFDQIYQEWVQENAKQGPTSDIQAAVMNRIDEYEGQRQSARTRLPNVAMVISQHVGAKAALLMGGTALGLLRILFSVRIIFIR